MVLLFSVLQTKWEETVKFSFNQKIDQQYSPLLTPTEEQGIENGFVG